jgi:hypothetical protein
MPKYPTIEFKNMNEDAAGYFVRPDPAYQISVSASLRED